MARYHHEGIHTVLVTCTGGEEGDILNPAMDKPGVREHMAEIRARELDQAARIIGYDEVVMLGYRDSGMPDSPANNDPRSFAKAPLDEAVGRLVAVIRRTRPQVVVTYPPNQNGYPHPDHLRVNEISEAAFDAAPDPERYPEAGPAWQPLPPVLRQVVRGPAAGDAREVPGARVGVPALGTHGPDARCRRGGGAIG